MLAVARAVALTLPASVCAVLLIRAAAAGILHPEPQFAPFAPAIEIMDTVFGVLAATFVFARIVRASSRPLRTWRRVAAWTLGVSFIPDLLLGAGHWLGGAWPEAIVLMLMHVAGLGALRDLVTRNGKRVQARTGPGRSGARPECLALPHQF